MKIIEKDQALLVEALRDFEDSRHYKDKVISRKAGEKWYVKGPKTYYENVMVKVLSTVKSKIIKPNCALKLTAQHKLIDINKKVRHAGE
jgi:hypothetical protein